MAELCQELRRPIPLGLWRKLFPSRLVDMKKLRVWECLDSDTGEDSTFIGFRRDNLAEEVRKYHIPDFSNWKNHDAFEKAFARLEQGFADQHRRKRLGAIGSEVGTVTWA